MPIGAVAPAALLGRPPCLSVLVPNVRTMSVISTTTIGSDRLVFLPLPPLFFAALVYRWLDDSISRHFRLVTKGIIKLEILEHVEGWERLLNNRQYYWTHGELPKMSPM